MSFTPRSRQILKAMGVPLWYPRAPKPHRDALCNETQQSPKPVPQSRVEGTEPFDLEAWEALQDRAMACTACSLAQSRTHVVFGRGSVGAKWLFVGEAPGAQEDRQGKAFVGRAGRLLDSIFHAMELNSDDVYIANVLKCRPPSNRDPLGEEVSQCLPFLKAQVALLQPQLIVAMGRFAAQALLNTQTPIARLRNTVHQYQYIPLIVTYHPAYLLRAGSEKAKVWDDMWMALQQMKMLQR